MSKELEHFPGSPDQPQGDLGFVYDLLGSAQAAYTESYTAIQAIYDRQTGEAATVEGIHNNIEQRERNASWIQGGLRELVRGVGYTATTRGRHSYIMCDVAELVDAKRLTASTLLQHEKNNPYSGYVYTAEESGVYIPVGYRVATDLRTQKGQPVGSMYIARVDMLGGANETLGSGEPFRKLGIAHYKYEGMVARANKGLLTPLDEGAINQLYNPITRRFEGEFYGRTSLPIKDVRYTEKFKGDTASQQDLIKYASEIEIGHYTTKDGCISPEVTGSNDDWLIGPSDQDLINYNMPNQLARLALLFGKPEVFRKQIQSLALNTKPTDK